MTFRYKMKVINFNEKEAEVTGIVFGDNYRDAFNKLTGYYGEDEIIEISYFASVADGAVVELGDNTEDLERYNIADEMLVHFQVNYVW